MKPFLGSHLFDTGKLSEKKTALANIRQVVVVVVFLFVVCMAP